MGKFCPDICKAMHIFHIYRPFSSLELGGHPVTNVFVINALQRK
jgi:hypothetical protein